LGALMFTGIVEELGTVRAVTPNATGARLEIEASTVLEDVALGASIAVNGCCLTAVAFEAGWWAADAVEETLRRTCLGALRAGDRVNLERPVRLADRLGGHIVQGHVDGVGRIADKEPLADGSTRVTVAADEAILRYVVEKGSITVDGASLTVAAVGEKSFEFAMIPHTATVTTLGIKGPGDLVNLEVDLVAKYVERLMSQKEG
ncbi:MAG TPA: riboflavin synthase, partial [Acidimicrobiia bacterium]|nr:riboflavin synthase [Acidimicrobiia bacterium]